jgi:tetratricopeptide (TPR) repeat protein
MDCDEIEKGEIAEKYVTGGLGEIEQADFEMHFLDCERCFAQVELWQGMQAALARSPRTSVRWMAVLAVAASLLVAAGATWLRLRPASERGMARSAAPAATARDLTALAEFSPPRYSQPLWRGASQTGFEGAMQRYSKGDYAAATPGLLAALKADPANSAAQFFLGICYLMQGLDDEGIARLKATIALEDSPELEEAHYYLAKALLRERDVNGAIAEVRQAIRLHGPRQRDEQSLLENITEVRSAQ